MSYIEYYLGQFMSDKSYKTIAAEVYDKKYKISSEQIMKSFGIVKENNVCLITEPAIDSLSGYELDKYGKSIGVERVEYIFNKESDKDYKERIITKEKKDLAATASTQIKEEEKITKSGKELEVDLFAVVFTTDKDKLRICDKRSSTALAIYEKINYREAEEDLVFWQDRDKDQKDKYSIIKLYP